MLCDVFTIEESFAKSAQGPRAIEKMKIAFVGDGSSNMARSWVEAARIQSYSLRSDCIC